MPHADALPGGDTILDDSDIVAARPNRNALSAWEPYAFSAEPECSAAGIVEPVATIFLTNRECSFRCVMCDLWKNTLRERVPLGAIGAQIDLALKQLPPANHIKLYNSGNFFDAQAIPTADLTAIAERVSDFQTVIVENHPLLCGPACKEFASQLQGTFEIAMGLETVHPEVLPRLNKRMTVDDYDRALTYLRDNDIEVRTFILLNPPFMPPADAHQWCLRSVEHAFASGSRVCSIIPTRGGNGAMEVIAQRGGYQRPSLTQLEAVHAAALELAVSNTPSKFTTAGFRRHRVLVDLWDAAQFADCVLCRDQRIARLNRMNLRQLVERPIDCNACAGSA